MRRLLLLVVAWLALLAAPALAHPLGNFTVNTADQVVLVEDGVEVVHLVDLAEIPSVQLRGRWDADRDDRLSAPELAAYAADTCTADAGALALTVAGRDVPLTLVSSAAEVRPGQGGLPTTRLDCRLQADAGGGAVVFTDDSSAGRTGWREVTVTARCGSVSSSDVPGESPSALLTAYPEDLLSSPVDVRRAAFTAAPGPCTGSASTDRAERTALPRGLGGLASAVTDFLGRPDLTVPFALLSALAALAFGAVHALAPGHGKTVLAAYLVGQRGTRRQALQLGAVVTFTHTASVLLLGAVLALGTLASPERVVPVTEVVSGVLLAAVGVYLLVLAVRRRRAGVAHDHDHGPHEHDHDHDHDHDHEPHDLARSSADGRRHAVGSDNEVTLAVGPAAAPHPHDHDHDHGQHEHGPHEHEHHDHDHDHDHERPEPVRAGTVALAPAPLAHSHGGRAHTHALPEGPLSWRTLAGMGVAGGLVPSPSALVVLLGATYLGRAWFGVVLVLLYGLGMAATLTVAGLLLLRAQAVLDRRGWAFGRGTSLGRLLPLLTAGVVVGVGLVLVVRGLQSSAALG